MEFVSVLGNKKIDVPSNYSVPAFFVDLNLDQIIEQIQSLSLVPVRKFFYNIPEDKECENYRRAIYADVKNPEVHKLLVDFAEGVEERKHALERKNAVSFKLQRFVWHVQEVAIYCDAFSKLYKGLLKANIHSEGLQALRDYLAEYVTSDAYVMMRKKALEIREKLESFHIKLVLENDQILVSVERVKGTYEAYLRKYVGEQNLQMKSPFSSSIDLSDFEQEITRKITRQQPDFFDKVEAFYKKYECYEDETLIRFGEEISYYLAYYTFQHKMELQGFSFVAPTVDENKDMSANGLYDLALACSSIKSQKEVVSNDMLYDKGESFFVVTGPNQGGKTTFARSLGQLVYFCKMGLDVPATAANVHYFSNILTHFSVEESVETGRGKLMDELVRLKPMMDAECQNAFVVINELFTTAANYDACIMGKKVLEHFISQKCRGIYVTHLKELTETHESVVSMRAMLDEQNIQCFKICRKPGEDSACAINQVSKHRLTYEQLKERLG